MLKSITAALTLTLSATMATAVQAADYQVTITNITSGQTFTPRLVVTHPADVSLYTLGMPASPELAILAESGNPSALIDSLVNSARDIQVSDGLLGPGESAVINISGKQVRERLSIAAMLIPTNDTFVALDSVPLPRSRNHDGTYFLQAYDAGSEYNDQSCQNMPGPRCGGAAISEPADSDEGFVHIGNGFHQLGDTDEDGFEILSPMTYDWGNSVAYVVVKRMR